jgi:serine/threonine protein phosphatase 1
MGRTLCVGDIHGGLKALQQIWEKANVSVGDKIIFLGDYVDGWGESCETIQHLIELDEKFNCIFLQGNHDAWCRDWLVSGMIPTFSTDFTWMDTGGKSTIESYNRNVNVDKEKHRKFFNGLHFYYEDEKRVFVHGGYTQGGGPRFENPPKNLWWDRSLFEKALTHAKKFKKNKELYAQLMPVILMAYDEIFVGHTSTQLYDTIQPIQACNVTNVDTGGGHRHGRLTIMDVDTKEYWQSDKLKDLYPDDPQNEYFRDEGKDLE